MSAKEMLALARKLYEEGKTHESLRLAESAYRLSPNPKTALKIERLQAVLKQKDGVKVEEKENEENNSDRQEVAATLEAEGRQLFLRDHLRPAMEKLCQAYKLNPTDKLQRRIERLEHVIREREDSVGAKDKQLPTRIDDLISQAGNLSIHEKEKNSQKGFELAPGFTLPDSLYHKLYPYQQEGIAWLWNLHKSSSGGILADDMGLGKTFQVSCFTLNHVFFNLFATCDSVLPFFNFSCLFHLQYVLNQLSLCFQLVHEQIILQPIVVLQ